MNGPKYPLDEIGDRGEAIYREKLQHLNRPENVGKYVIIDIETGDYEMGDDGDAASDRIHARRPDGEFYEVLIGYRASGVIGGSMEDLRIC